jgi:hypothetical protein
VQKYHFLYGSTFQGPGTFSSNDFSSFQRAGASRYSAALLQSLHGLRKVDLSSCSVWWDEADDITGQCFFGPVKSMNWKGRRLFHSLSLGIQDDPSTCQVTLKKKKHAVLVLQQATSDATEVLCYPEALLNSKNSSWMFVAFQFGVTGHVIPCLYHPYLGHWWVIITVILNRVGMTCIKSSLVEDRIWKTQFTKTI